MSPEELRHLSRPFPAEILTRARALAKQYRLVIESDDEGGYMGRTLELPSSMGGGESVAACAADTLEATVLSIATMLENGQTPPAPAREGKRETQVNIRLSVEERFRLEQAASNAGYRSLSDYIRAAAIKFAS